MFCVSATNSIWNADNQTTHVISNPFTSNDVWRPSVNVINNNMQPENSLCNPINPFKQVQFPVNNGKFLNENIPFRVSYNIKKDIYFVIIINLFKSNCVYVYDYSIVLIAFYVIISCNIK